MLNRRPRHEPEEKDTTWSAEVRAVNSERSKLLDRKHGGGPFTPEDQTRLDWLQARTNQLVPSVTEKEWETLREIERRSDEREAVLLEIRKHARQR